MYESARHASEAADCTRNALSSIKNAYPLFRDRWANLEQTLRWTNARGATPTLRGAKLGSRPARHADLLDVAMVGAATAAEHVDLGVAPRRLASGNLFRLSRRQGARAWELRTATDLATLLANRGQRRDADGLLRPVFEWFEEGRDTADPKAAERLLASLR